ncbi:MAG TPA: aminotransferase class V-fold PLP-dependent enzyme, partial [Longimicrobiales bacterium]|nr:aminotransferase class V-fold PLP-dependent enzyme [Longimicrobiales bacterium]
MQWQTWRAEFPILSRKTYLNSCSLGALSHRSEARVRQFHEDWHNFGASAWYETWIGRHAELRGRVARMFNVADAEIGLAHSTSAALSTIASGVNYTHRNKIVVADLDFPTLAYQWLNRPDVEVVFVPSDDGATVDPQRFADVVDERTAFVATSHVFYATGAIQDLGALSQIAHAKGALLLVDGYQSVGQIPVDLSSGDVDIFLGGPLKWLLGGPGICYMYVRKDLIDQIAPQATGWFAARDQFGFDIHSFEHKDDARRFELGTPALHMVHCALGGQEIIDEVSMPAIRARNQQLAEMTIDRARENGFGIRAAATRDARSAIVMIAMDDPAGAVAHLAERNIIID